jgi:hypothetical protein
MPKRYSTLLGWCLVSIFIGMIVILIYPSVFQVARSQADKESSKVIEPYQVAIIRCIQKNNNQLQRCNAGEENIPAAYSSWFRSVKSIHVYQGVIQVRIHLSLGEPVFVFYIPHLVRRRWSSSTTYPNTSVIWQRIETNYCGLRKKNESCNSRFPAGSSPVRGSSVLKEGGMKNS